MNQFVQEEHAEFEPIMMKGAPMMQILFFVMLAFFSVFLSTLVLLGLGFASPDAIINASTGELRWLVFVNQFFTFLLPGLLFGFILFKTNWARFFNLHKSPRIRNVLIGMAAMAVATPLIYYTVWLNQQIPMPDLLSEMEESSANIISQLLTMDTIWVLLINILLIGVLPAVGEELVFRGIIQKKFEQATGRGGLAVWLSAFLFSALHLQFEGFIPRLILGAILGYLYLYTKNLWVPILGHLFNNGAQVVIEYVRPGEFDLAQTEAVEQPPFWWLLVGIAGVVFLLYLLKGKPFKDGKNQAAAADQNWKMIYRSSDAVQVELVKTMLTAREIDAVVLDKRVSAYNLGDLELHVAQKDILRAQTLIENYISEHGTA